MTFLGDFSKNDVIDGCKNGLIPFTFHEKMRRRSVVKGVMGRDATDGANKDGAESRMRLVGGGLMLRLAMLGLRQYRLQV